MKKIWHATRSNSKYFVIGIVLYFLAYFLLSILIPALTMWTSLKLNYWDPLSILRVLTWHTDLSKKVSLFVTQSLFAVTGMSTGLVRWQFVFSLRDLCIQLPLAALMGAHLSLTKELRRVCKIRPLSEMSTVRFKSGVYATPFGAFCSAILNTGIWLGGCGSCGTIVGTTLLTLFGLGVNSALSGFFYFLALSVMSASVLYLGWRLPNSHG